MRALALSIVLTACAPVVLAAVTLLFMGRRQPDEVSAAALARGKQ